MEKERKRVRDNVGPGRRERAYFLFFNKKNMLKLHISKALNKNKILNVWNYITAHIFLYRLVLIKGLK